MMEEEKTLPIKIYGTIYHTAVDMVQEGKDKEEIISYILSKDIPKEFLVDIAFNVGVFSGSNHY